MDDRRKYFRFDVPVDLKYTREKDKSRARTQASNISREGVSFSTPRRVEQEDVLKIEFSIPGNTMPVFANGIVAWTKETKLGKKKVFDVGIKFVQFSRTDRGKMLEFIYKKWLMKRKDKKKK